MKIVRLTRDCSLIALALSGAGAIAQPIDADTPASDLGAGEIVVTAQKRVQSLKDVPLSVAVVSGEVALTRNNTAVDAMVQQIPNVSVTRANGGNQLYVRGVGSGINPGFEQSVGMFVDGIYHGRSRLSGTSVLDVDRVEVLRGPQSIFFGNNTIAGALSVVSKRPTATWEGNASTSYEFEDNEANIQAAVGGPISDKIGIRLAGMYNDLGGYLKNTNTGRSDVDIRSFVTRGTIDFEPTDNFTITVAGTLGRERSNAPSAWQVGTCPPRPPFTAGALCNIALGLGLETKVDDRRAAQPGERGKTNYGMLLLNAEYEFPGGPTVTSTTGYMSQKFYMSQDLDSTPASFANVTQTDDIKQFSQELRLASPGGGPIEYMLGAYYMHSNLKALQSVLYHFRTSAVQPGSVFAPLIPFAEDGLGDLASLKQTEDQIAAFASLTWRVTDRLRLNGGLRWTQSKKKGVQRSLVISNQGLYGWGPDRNFTPLPDNLMALGGQLVFTNVHEQGDTIKSDKFLPSVSVQYDLSERMTGYASFSQGVKAGGFDLRANHAPGSGLGALTFEPETVDAYEIGLKGRWPSIGLSVNTALFYNKYTNLQQSVAVNFSGGGFGFTVANVGSLVSKGIELDVGWRASERLRFELSGAYLDTTYKNYQDAGCTALQILGTPAGVPCTQDLSGQRPPFAPKYSAQASADYRMPIGERMEAFFQPMLVYRDRFHTISDNDPNGDQKSFLKVDARIGLSSTNGWEIALLGKNIFDKQTVSFVQDLTASPGSYLYQVDRDRTIALQLMYKW